MDKNDAINLIDNYLRKVRNNNVNVLSAYLFGSYAKGNYTADSDIDVALILPDNQCSFDTDVRLMSMRKGEETKIETHTYTQKEFLATIPIINQIKQYGISI